MENVKMTVDDNKLTIEVDLDHRGAISKTGKSKRVASTEGNQKLDGHAGIMVGLNIYEKV